MDVFVLNALGVIGVAVVAAVTMYRLGPGLSDAMSAWANRRETLTTRRLVEEWADGYEAGLTRGARQKEAS